MQKIRIHGRGGQGSVTLANLIAEAAFEEGSWAQSFPAFGVERRGAPVEAFTRIGETRITDRSQVSEPTFVVVQDRSLIDFVDVLAGLVDDGIVIVNTTADRSTLPIADRCTVVTIGATDIALEHLGLPIANTALLGAFAGASGLFELESVGSAITTTFPGEIGAKNVRAAVQAFGEVRGG